MKKLDNKVAVITGGTSGTGLVRRRSERRCGKTLHRNLSLTSRLNLVLH
jgi:NADP-dependent 3-hydroxy acid dehydrogenase YdfG